VKNLSAQHKEDRPVFLVKPSASAYHRGIFVLMMTATIRHNESPEVAIAMSCEEMKNVICYVVKREKQVLFKASGLSIKAMQKMIDAKLFSLVNLN
jgi:hypothetical protein